MDSNNQPSGISSACLLDRKNSPTFRPPPLESREKQPTFIVWEDGPDIQVPLLTPTPKPGNFWRVSESPLSNTEPKGFHAQQPGSKSMQHLKNGILSMRGILSQIFCVSARPVRGSDATGHAHIVKSHQTSLTPVIEEDTEPDVVTEASRMSEGTLSCTIVKHEWSTSRKMFPMSGSDEPCASICHRVNTSTLQEFSWMFVFSQPSILTVAKQRSFEKRLRRRGLTWTEAVYQAFTFVNEEDVVEAVGAKLPFSEKSAWGSMRKGLFGHRCCFRRRDPQPADSWSRSQQCTIELFLEFFNTLNKSIYEAFERHQQKCSQPKNQLKVKEYIRYLPFNSQRGDAVCICVRAEKSLLERFASLIDYPVQLDRESMKKLLGINLPAESNPAHVRYCTQLNRDLFRVHADSYEDETSPSILAHRDCVRLLFDKVTDHVHLHELRRLGLIDMCCPLHHLTTLKKLRETWGDMKLIFSLSQPLDDVRDYFGEEIAFYFLFLRELAGWTRWLLVPAALFEFWNWYAEEERPALSFSITIMLWFYCFLKHWRRTENLYANAWGLLSHRRSTFKDLSNNRFIGELMDSELGEEESGKKKQTSQVSDKKKRVGKCLSVVLSILFIVAFISVVALELKFFHTLLERYPAAQQYLMTFQGCFAGMFIMLVDVIWAKISLLITDLECHGKALEFFWSVAAKTCVVRWIITGSTLFYFAFVFPVLNKTDNCPGSCDEYYKKVLRTQLLIIFVTRFLLLSIFSDLVQPAVKFRQSLEKHKCTEAPFIEQQRHMNKYKSTDIADDFLKVLLPFSFVALFGMVTPKSIFLLFFICLVQVRTVAWKLVHVFQRPYPHVIEDIGFFNDLLNFFGVAMIGANLGILMIHFDNNLVFDWVRHIMQSFNVVVQGKSSRRVLNTIVFFVLATVLLLVRSFINFIVSSTPSFLELELRRQAFQCFKVFDKDREVDGVSLKKVSLCSRALSEKNEREDFNKLAHLRGPTWQSSAS